MPHTHTFTKTPNTYFDLLPELTIAETKILAVIIRSTYGWQKEYDWISYSQFVKRTGCSRRAISTAVNSLSNKGFIDIAVHNHQYLYSFQVRGAKHTLEPLQTLHPTKEIFTKEKVGGNECAKMISVGEIMRKVLR